MQSPIELFSGELFRKLTEDTLSLKDPNQQKANCTAEVL